MDLNASIETLISTGQKIGQPIGTEAVHFAVIPTGTQLVSLASYQFPHGMPPERIAAAPAFQDAGSFCVYVNSYKDARTRIFADAQKNSFTAVLDYHGTGEAKPEFLSHKATLSLKFSEEWALWFGYHDKLIPQATFAEFLEDNRADIIRPDSATMLEIAKELQANSEVNFQSKINTVNGSAVLKFEETINAKVGTGQIQCPEIFAIKIPVFYGEDPVEISARLRFRISDSKLKFQYKLYRPAETIALAFDAARGRIKAGTDIEVLLGSL